MTRVLDDILLFACTAALVTGMVLSHLFFFFALILLHKTALAFELDKDAANRAILYLAIFPVSYFFSLPGGGFGRPRCPFQAALISRCWEPGQLQRGQTC